MTTDDKDLVERLRAPAGEFTSILDRAEAADRIEQLSSALEAVQACRMESGEGKFVNLANLRKAMVLVDVALDGLPA
jgi:hypothetical protein